MTATRDMTKGAPLPHLWAFALPVLLGNWLQLLYNAVDTVLAGRFIGQQALAAEGIAAPIMNLVILGVSGLCTGAGVLMSEHFGAGRIGDLRRTLGALMRFGLIASLALVILGWVFSPLLMDLLNCPAEIHAIAVTYLRITFLGAPFTCLYNALAAGLKSAGNTGAAPVPDMLGGAQRGAGPVFPGSAALRRRLQRGHHGGGRSGQRNSGFLVRAHQGHRALPGKA